ATLARSRARSASPSRRRGFIYEGERHISHPPLTRAPSGAGSAGAQAPRRHSRLRATVRGTPPRPRRSRTATCDNVSSATTLASLVLHAMAVRRLDNSPWPIPFSIDDEAQLVF